MSIFRGTLQYDKQGYDGLRIEQYLGGKVNNPHNWDIVCTGDMLCVAADLPTSAWPKFTHARRFKRPAFYFCDIRY